MKGVRRILKIPPTQIDRERTNKKYGKSGKRSRKDPTKIHSYVDKTAFQLSRPPTKGKGRRPPPSSCLQQKQKNAKHYLSFNIRKTQKRMASRSDGRSLQCNYGKPLYHFNFNNEEHLNWLIGVAHDRTGIFVTNTKPTNTDMFKIEHNCQITA